MIQISRPTCFVRRDGSFNVFFRQTFTISFAHACSFSGGINKQCRFVGSFDQIISFGGGGGGGRGQGEKGIDGDIHPRTYVWTGPSHIMLTFLYSSDFFLLQFYNELLNEAILNAYSNPLMAGLFEKHLELYKFLICEQRNKTRFI